MTNTGFAPPVDAASGSAGRRVLTLSVLTGVQFLAVLDGLSVTLALPAIGAELDLSASGLAWMVNAYTLALVGGLLLAGRLTDVRGHRPVLVGGLVLLSLGAAAAGLADSSPVLVLARIVQGCGAALCYPAAMALVGDLFPDEPWRSRAFAAGAVAASSGAAAGAVFGGAVTGLLGWPWVFLLTVPVGMILVVGARLLLPRPARRSPRPLDLPGAALGAGAAVSTVLVLARLEHPHVTDPVLVAAAVAAPLLWVGWWRWEQRQVDPLLPPALLQSRLLLGGCVGIAANSALYCGTIFVGTLQLQQTLRLGPIEAGIAFLPLSGASIVAGLLIVTPLRGRFGSGRTGVAGLVLGASSLLVLAVLPTKAGIVPFVALQLPIGVALATAFTSFTADTIGGSRPTVRGITAGVFETATHLAGAVSIAAFATTIGLTAVHGGYLTAAALTAAGAIGAGLVLRHEPANIASRRQTTTPPCTEQEPP